MSPNFPDDAQITLVQRNQARPLQREQRRPRDAGDLSTFKPEANLVIVPAEIENDDTRRELHDVTFELYPALICSPIYSACFPKRRLKFLCTSTRC